MSRAELKQKAKNSLKGKYSQAILVIIFMGIISGVVTGVIGGATSNYSEQTSSFIVSVCSVIVTALFTPGYISFFLKISRNEEVTYQELFSKTKLFVPFIILEILVGIFTFLWSLLFIIPGIIAAISYTLTSFILVDNPDMKAIDIIKKSKEMMRGHKMDFFILQLSFIGWGILGVFTLGILYFWLIPYMCVTEANFYNMIKEQNNA